jgi:hypothetical protein
MGFWDGLLKAEQNIRKRVESAFGHGAARTPLEVRREILEQVESRIVVDTNGSQFPFGKIMVQLQPPTEALRDVFAAAFLQGESLKSEIVAKLKASEARYPTQLEIVMEIQPPPSTASAAPGPMFRLDFISPDLSKKPEISETVLTILKGSAEQPEYRFRRERILVGRLAEVTDREGRLVRKNDVVFLDNGEDINSTVGRAHARIWYDLEKQDFCIIDEASRYGTRVLREGRSIEVPGGNSRGIRLRSGDEIYVGQACIKWLVVSG